MSTRDALTPSRTALAVGLAAVATVGGALALEHGFGVKPCELCLVQRIPYYIGAPFALVTAGVVSRRPRGLIAMGCCCRSPSCSWSAPAWAPTTPESSGDCGRDPRTAPDR